MAPQEGTGDLMDPSKLKVCPKHGDYYGFECHYCRPIFCKGCGKQMDMPYEYCNSCAETLPEYDYAKDDQNFDAEREKGR